MCFLDRKTNEIYTFFNSGRDPQIARFKVILKGNELSESFKVHEPIEYVTFSSLFERKLKMDGIPFDLGTLNCTYINNVLGQHHEEVYKNILNLSTSSLLTKVIDRIVVEEIRESKKESKKETIQLFPTYLKTFRKEELKNWIRFLAFANASEYELPTFIPKNITIDFHFDDPDLYDSKNFKLSAYRSRAIQLKELAIKYTSEIYKGQHRIRFLVLIYTSIIIYFIKEFGNQTDGIMSHTVNEILDSEIYRAKDDDLLRRLRICINQLYEKITNSDWADQLRPFIEEKLENMILWIDFEDKEVTQGSFFRYFLPIKADLWRLLSPIFGLNQTVEADILSFSFGHGLSSGEEAMLHNYSKLMLARRKWKGRPFLLLIDEGEASYHPEWQRLYLNELMKVIKVLFQPGQIQLILTTHSPFIVSDLPKSNILFLERSKEKGVVVVNRQNHQETFAANIHELYTDSFFLCNGLMGAYATDFVRKMIRDIRDIEDGRLNLVSYKENFEKQIKMIGEPFIKNMLLDSLIPKSDFETVGSIIRLKEAEIEKLKTKRISKKNHDSNSTSVE
ncbi:hypothetical protein Cpin_3514 [Chitinophaga pinensis DSM 2588]|uniref:Endonuclease GajA/Old nuclease/RecF-like AAA domain-containing protein n=2 Tax=Chitinophaga pinensis TaxID=79329 RepID=A0A979GRV8_CHIPD|nr:hypothetical protein Cpin_3514 [Chitinophaga pinensis DSM 2588]